MPSSTATCHVRDAQRGLGGTGQKYRASQASRVTVTSLIVPLHPRLLLQLPNLHARLALPHLPRHLLPGLLRHHSHIPHLLARRRIITRRPTLGILYRCTCLCVWVLRVLVFQLVDLGRGFGFVERIGVDVGVFAGGESGKEALLFFGRGVGAGGPLGGVVELGGH